jgi:hypothetical protein
MISEYFRPLRLCALCVEGGLSMKFFDEAKIEVIAGDGAGYACRRC